MTTPASNMTFGDRVNRFFSWVSEHWLAVFNSIVATYVFLPILAPILLLVGAEQPASAIYTIYKPTCHQMAFRSFFIGGDQIVYPRELAQTDHVHFEAYAETLPQFAGISLEGLPPDLIVAARSFTGNAEMGFKTAICQRDLNIFGWLLIGGLLYATVGRKFKVKPLPLLAFIIIGMGPIGLDGFSQLFGYYGEFVSPLSVFPVRESTPLLRSATGAWFGFCVAWLALPYIDMEMRRGQNS